MMLLVNCQKCGTWRTDRVYPLVKNMPLCQRCGGEVLEVVGEEMSHESLSSAHKKMLYLFRGRLTTMPDMVLEGELKKVTSSWLRAVKLIMSFVDAHNFDEDVIDLSMVCGMLEFGHQRLLQELVKTQEERTKLKEN